MMVSEPFTETMGVFRDTDESGPFLRLPFDPALAGRTGFFQGGIIGALLELACLESLAGGEAAMATATGHPVNLAVDFIRDARARDLFARATIVRKGKRIANVAAVAWQDDPNTPVATARMHILVEKE